MVKVLTLLAVTAMAACSLSNSAHVVHFQPTNSTRKLQERAVTRRAQAVERLRQEHQQRRLDGATVVTTTHVSGLTGITATTSASVLFGSTAPCVAEPELTEGPYYVGGEFIRTDMREEQTGVTMYVDVQVIDVNTCEPVKDMYVDLWHTNSTGVYSGVVASTNGDSTDTSNLKNTFLRGVTPTDKDGVAQMISIFPGHYAGRTTHVHFIGNYGGTVLSNNTYSGGSVAHGQFFFDQDLITSVESVTPYSTNKQTITLNKNDNIFKQASASGYDPVMNYALLGDTVKDGIFVWISVAVDMTANRDVKAVSTLTGTSTTTSTSDTNEAFSICKFGGVAVLVAAFAPIVLAIF